METIAAAVCAVIVVLFLIWLIHRPERIPVASRHVQGRRKNDHASTITRGPSPNTQSGAYVPGSSGPVCTCQTGRQNTADPNDESKGDASQPRFLDMETQSTQDEHPN
jgi:hypothetical protein